MDWAAAALLICITQRSDRWRTTWNPGLVSQQIYSPSAFMLVKPGSWKIKRFTCLRENATHRRFDHFIQLTSVSDTATHVAAHCGVKTLCWILFVWAVYCTYAFMLLWTMWHWRMFDEHLRKREKKLVFRLCLSGRPVLYRRELTFHPMDFNLIALLKVGRALQFLFLLLLLLLLEFWTKSFPVWVIWW